MIQRRSVRDGCSELIHESLILTITDHKLAKISATIFHENGPEFEWSIFMFGIEIKLQEKQEPRRKCKQKKIWLTNFLAIWIEASYSRFTNKQNVIRKQCTKNEPVTWDDDDEETQAQACLSLLIFFPAPHTPPNKGEIQKHRGNMTRAVPVWRYTAELGIKIFCTVKWYLLTDLTLRLRGLTEGCYHCYEWRSDRGVTV